MCVCEEGGKRETEIERERGHVCIRDAVPVMHVLTMLSVCYLTSFPCRQGAVDVEEENRKKEQERSAAFQGSGFRLGDSEGPSTVVRGSQRQTRPTERVEYP